MCRSSSPWGARPPPVKHAAVPDAIEHAAGDAADAEPGHVLEPVRLARENRLGRQQPAADRRPYALTEITRGEPGGIPGDEGIVAAYDIHAAAQVVAVAARVIARARGEAAAEHRGEP